MLVLSTLRDDFLRDVIQHRISVGFGDVNLDTASQKEKDTRVGVLLYVRPR